MKLVKSAAEMRAISGRARQEGKKISLVPTMGALHEGHLALFREVRRQGDVLVVSIYINPRQFNDAEDFRKYARDLEGDLKKCEAEGVDVVFAPPDSEIYPPADKAPIVPVPSVAAPLEGASRPGHFAGVVDVVSRLFRLVRPQTAIFGLKDYQQVRVIEEMVKEQKMDVRIFRHPTVREKDGLAMSSRNARLSPKGRAAALAISRSLRAAEKLYSAGERRAPVIQSAVLTELQREPGITVDYAAVVDAETLKELPTLNRPGLVAVAGSVEGVRLIDNGLLA